VTIANTSGFEKVLNQWAVVGAGKGGPSEDPDSLRSKASATVLAVFSEGEIQGFPTGISEEERKKRIFLDDTPLVSEVGDDMFDDGVEISFRNGTQDQASLPGFDDIKVEQSLGLQVKKSVGPISATTTNSLLNQLVVRVGVGSLFRVTDDGDIKGDVVEFSITIRDLLGTIVNAGNTQFSIRGKTRGPFDRDYSFQLSGTGPWTVSVERLTNDPDSVRRNSDLFFRAIVGIINETLRYPNSSLVGIKVSAENFQSIPTISALLLGKKIKVPTIYNAASNSYSGVWNGSWKVEYNNNPVWVFHDLLTNKRYGAGLFIEEDDIDIYSLLPIAKYCDEMVPDGRGGMEKRFTFNAYINNREDAFQVLNALASAFRGMLYYAQGQIIATQDVAKQSSKLFSPSNVVVEMDDNGNVTAPPFVYEGTARKARKTVALVSWNDRNDRYKGKIEYVEDRVGIERYGYRETDVRAFGCTSQGQAQRIGKWILLSDLYETETVSFKTGAEGFFVMPGEIVEIADPDKNTGILAGIAPSINGTNVTLDRPVVLASGISYQLIVSNENGNSITRAVTNAPGQYSSLTVSPSFPAELTGPAPWILRESVAQPRKYRVVGLTEEDGVVTVLATSYYEAKFTEADNFARIDEQRTSVQRINIVPVVSAGSIQLQRT
jgi:predicted phage tail protein